MAQFSAVVIRNLDDDVTIVQAHGVLDLETAAAMRGVLLQVIAECPTAVVVDVSDCTAGHPAALTVFPAVARHHAWQPLVPVSLGGADARFLAHGGLAALGNVPAYASTRSATTAAARTRRGQQRIVFTPDAHHGAPAQARGLVSDACEHWRLPELAAAAALVVSELVTNAVVHGHGQILMEAALREPFVRIRVHDGSTSEPVLGPPLEDRDLLHDHGRGMRLVERHCTAWGVLPKADGSGKVVWATLRARPIAGPQP